MVTHLGATEHHLHAGSHDTGERSSLQPLPSRQILDLPPAEGWKAELTGGWFYTKMVCLSADSSHLSSNHLIATQLGV